MGIIAELEEHWIVFAIIIAFLSHLGECDSVLGLNSRLDGVVFFHTSMK